MLLGGAILPPAETLVVEDELLLLLILLLLLPGEALPLLPAVDGLTASEEVPVPPLLLGSGPCGEKALSFGGFIFMPKRKDFAALPAETLVVEEEPLLLVGAGLFGAGANPRIPDEVLEGERKAR